MLMYVEGARERTLADDAHVDDARRSDWDAFVGPAALLQDDRWPVPFLPLMMAAHGIALAAELNSKWLEGMAGGPRRT